MKKKYDLQILLEKYRQNICTDEEKAIVESWFLRELEQAPELPGHEQLAHVDKQMNAAISRHLQSSNTRPLWPRIAAAASFILALSIGGYLLSRKQQAPQVLQIQAHTIMPGRNKAILTLSNGRQISLTDAGNGLLASQGNTTIKKAANGQVIYYNSNGSQLNSHSEPALVYNTMTTPRGGQYHLVLSDGTGVWLNSASSVRYPVNFTGKDRQVEITGEAYLEVVHHATRPFRVKVNGQIVEDIGTHFNVNAYTDEPVTKTTLVEGMVKVSTGRQSVLLSPGQQSLVREGNKILVTSGADTEEAVAWKNGYLRFNDEKIESIMRKLSRWYDIEVNYQGQVPTEGFNGKISRYKNISQVLHMLEYSKSVHFKVEGRRVTVMM